MGCRRSVLAADPRATARVAGFPFSKTSTGILAAIKVAPRAGRNAIEGPGSDADGGVFIRVSVTAAPDDGKANAAVIKLLSKVWRVAKSHISVASGATARRKTLHVAGNPDELLTALDTWWEKHNG